MTKNAIFDNCQQKGSRMIKHLFNDCKGSSDTKNSKYNKKSKMTFVLIKKILIISIFQEKSLKLDKMSEFICRNNKTLFIYPFFRRKMEK